MKDTKLNIWQIVYKALEYYAENPTDFEKDCNRLESFLDAKGELELYVGYFRPAFEQDSSMVVDLFDRYYESVEDELNLNDITPYIKDLFDRYTDSEFDGWFSQCDYTLETFKRCIEEGRF